MADINQTSGEGSEIEVEVVRPASRRPLPVRRVVLGCSIAGVVAAVALVIAGLSEPTSTVVVRSGGSVSDPSQSIGVTSTLPETTTDSSGDSVASSDAAVADSIGNGGTSVLGQPETPVIATTIPPPPPTANPPAPTSTVIPTLPPVTSSPTTFTTTIPDTTPTTVVP